MSRPATSRVSSPGAKGNGTPASSAKSSAGSSASATAPWSPDRKLTGPSSPRRSRGAVRRRTPGTGSFCDSAPVLETEAVVVGAGPSGATAALLLARGGHEVVLVDRARFPRDKACGEGLMPPGVEALRRLGLYERVLETGARPLRGITYRLAKGGPGVHLPFPIPPDGGAPEGLGIRRTSFDEALVDAVRRQPHATVGEGERVTGLIRDAAERVVGVATTAGEIRARIVIGADGLHSQVRAWAGLRARPQTRLRYGLAGHWRVETRDRDAVTVTLAGDHEWYEAPVGPDLLLV